MSPLARETKTERLLVTWTLSADDCTRRIEQLHDAVLRDMFLVGLGTLLRWTSRSMTPHHHRTNETLRPPDDAEPEF